ncbi:MAG: S9 family peptidase [Gemmatales bacterium]|nr:S9 family peptidase [Gemmatales bacterium]MDW8386640.1 S9 family peptidase [Gemmatales bacterium]
MQRLRGLAVCMLGFFAVCLLGAWVAAEPFALQEPFPPAKLPVDTSFLKELMETRSYQAGRPTNTQPTPDGSAVLFLRSEPRSPTNALYELNVETGQTRSLLTPAQVLQGTEEELSPEEKARRERMRVTARGFANFQLSPDGRLVLLTLSGKLYVFDRNNGSIKSLPTGKGTLLDPKFSPDGKYIGYVLDHDVYVLDLATLREVAVTRGGTEVVSHGLAEFVAQEEMDRHTGWWWSPDSRSIVFEEADNREVEVWSVADPFRPGRSAFTQYYPRPGKNNTKVRLGIVPVDPERFAAQEADSTAKVPEPLWIPWDMEKYPYLATVKWDKGGPLTILVQARSQQEMVLLRVDPTTGQTTPLLTEKDDAWLNLDQDVPHWLEDGSGFLWSSEREGHPQLELRDASGKLVRLLIPPSAGYQPSYAARGKGILGVDEKRGFVYFRGSEDPTQTHLYRVSLRDGNISRITQQTGLHSAVFSKDGSLYVHSFSGPKTMRRTFAVRIEDGKTVPLPSTALEPPFVPTTEVVKIGPDAGFWCAVTRPRQFQPRLRYPVIVDVYAGPGVQRVVESMGSYLTAQWIADQGFIVVSVDGRGTPGRGRDWERVLRGSFGVIPLEDQVTALKALGQVMPELDLERVGITGWSFGGYMAALAVLKRPDVFRAAVAGAPVCDWQDYDTHYTERYLGLPSENPKGYEESSLLTYAPKLARPLLIVHGTRDDNVYFVHALKLSDALFRAGKHHEVLPLAGQTHVVTDPQMRTRLQERTILFFREHLGSPLPGPAAR